MTQQEFLQAYDSYADAIFRHCALRLGDREDGKDLTQETFIRAWEAIIGGITVQNMRAYLYRIANNLIVDFARRRKRRPTSSLEELMEAGFNPPSREKGPAAAFEESFVLDTLQNIEEPYRTAVILRFIDGLPPREIASLLAVSPNVISVRVNRGIQKLQSLLTPNG
ncbi:MAG: RNA polymerase sigma factor [Candidatus Peribacteraceae bacterium]|nr:RNA polymerase sigma factor [Candidatus Peribacteraceae bacterium]MDD5741829.1 RNA polymerase sigma factor [Candidatus Peribacteraceae bacterium]